MKAPPPRGGAGAAGPPGHAGRNPRAARMRPPRPDRIPAGPLDTPARPPGARGLPAQVSTPARTETIPEKAQGGDGHGVKAPPRPKKAPPGPPRPAGAAPDREARGAQRRRYGKSDLAGTDSQYLCLFCYEPLYVDMNTDDEVCFNRGCIDYSNSGEISGNLAEHDGPRNIRKLCSENVREFRKFNRQFLLQKIHEMRATEYAMFFQKEGMNITILTSLDYLMTQLHDNTEWGSSRDWCACRAAFDDYYKNFDIMQFTEDICSRYYVTNARSQQFVIKYHHPIRDFFKSLGMVSDSQNRAGPLPFYHIDKKSMRSPAKSMFDFEAIYKNSLPLINALNHAFKMRHSTSKMYGYPARSADFIVLLSLWITCPVDSAASVTVDDLRENYDGATRKNKMDENFGQFLEDYTSGRAYAPILVFDGERYRFDYAALLLHLIYLFSNNSSCSGTQTEAGRTAYDRMRQDAALQFEVEIRQKLRGDGFDVRPMPGDGPFRPSFDSERKEFDCVAVDRERKIIVIVEAKYEDIAPSSMSAATMVNQLVLDKKTGLLAHAKKHHSRREFFKRHFKGMGWRGLRLPGGFLDYDVHTLLVTKHEPLISRHMSVDILSYAKFMSIDFRSHSLRDELDGASAVSQPGQQGAGAAGGTARPAQKKGRLGAAARGRLGR